MLFNKKTLSLKNLKNRFLLNQSFLKKELISKGLPTEITIELTNKCNLHCIMCPHDKMKRKQGFMSFDLFKKIINQIKDHVEIVDLDLFGESLLNPEAFKMIKYCSSQGIKTLINSNMTHMNKEKSQKLIDSGLDMLTISFDGATKQTYEKIRKPANYEKTLKNIKTFLKLKGKNKKPHTRIQMIYMTHTEDEAKKFLDIWKNTNTDFVRIKPFINLDREKNFYATKLKQKTNIKPCIYLWRNLSIYWNGDVVPCCDDYDSMYVVGNVNEKPLKKIWNEHPLVELRKKHLQGKQKLVRLCKECRYFEPSNLFVIGSIFIDAFTARQILPFFEKMIILKNKKFLKY